METLNCTEEWHMILTLIKKVKESKKLESENKSSQKGEGVGVMRGVDYILVSELHIYYM